MVQSHNHLFTHKMKRKWNYGHGMACIEIILNEIIDNSSRKRNDLRAVIVNITMLAISLKSYYYLQRKNVSDIT